MRTIPFATKTLAGLILMGAAAQAQAQEGMMWLSLPGDDAVPTQPIVVDQGPFSLDLHLRLPENVLTIGGGVDFAISQDPASPASAMVIEYADFLFDANSAAGTFDDDFSNPPTRIPLGGALQGLNALTVGNFDGLGSGRIGTLTFVAQNLGDVEISMSASTFAGGFFDTSGLPIAMEFTPTMITAVPESDVLMLMMAGMGVLGWKLRRRQHTATETAV